MMHTTELMLCRPSDMLLETT